MIHLYQDTPIGGGDALYAMTDVNINNPEDGQMLVYDASTQRWRNVTQKSLNDLAEVTDLTNVIATGSTNATGATIPKGLYFYLNDELCLAKSDIASGATFTLNTNYEVVTAGGLNSLNSALTAQKIKRSYIQGTTDTNGVIWTNLSVTSMQILSAWLNAGGNTDRFVYIGCRDGKYGFMATNAAFGKASGQGVTIYYEYVDIV